MMVRSMTGYGQAERVVRDFRIHVDVKTVNHRFIEVSIRMPQTWLWLEDALKKKVMSFVRRGRVDVFITIEHAPNVSVEVQVDMNLVKGYLDVSRSLATSYGIRPIDSVSELLKIPELFQVKGPEVGDEAIKQAVLSCMDEAIEQLMKMREAEGRHLLDDVRNRLHKLELLYSKVQDEYPKFLDHHRKKLRERISTLLQDQSLSFDEQRFNMEIALIAERSNIDEELTRLSSHMKQFHEILCSEKAIGRKLDFLIQEMNREINTIGSKSSHPTLAQLVVEMKSELEKLREQVQNME